MAARVLVVDDDRSICDLVTRLLKDHGLHVDSASDGFSALELASQHKYALAVLDYQMPAMNGVELFRQLRQIQPDTRGLFLTAYPTINTVFPAIDAGIERVLPKPVNAVELIPLVDELLAPPG